MASGVCNRAGTPARAWTQLRRGIAEIVYPGDSRACVDATSCLWTEAGGQVGLPRARGRNHARHIRLKPSGGTPARAWTQLSGAAQRRFGGGDSRARVDATFSGGTRLSRRVAGTPARAWTQLAGGLLGIPHFGDSRARVDATANRCSDHQRLAGLPRARGRNHFRNRRLAESLGTPARAWTQRLPAWRCVPARRDSRACMDATHHGASHEPGNPRGIRRSFHWRDIIGIPSSFNAQRADQPCKTILSILFFRP